MLLSGRCVKHATGLNPSGRLGQRGLRAAAWDLKADGVLQLVELPLQAR